MWNRSVLVVANVTATSPELRTALARRAEGGKLAVTLLIPSPPIGEQPEVAAARLEEALTGLRADGFTARGEVVDADPVVAVTEHWNPREYDEIMISTLPEEISRWVHAGMPERVAKLTGAQVTHVISRPPRPESVTGPPPEPGHFGVLTPLTALGTGNRR